MTAKSPCPGRDALERLLLGDMPDLEMKVLEGHVAQCPRCLNVIRAVNRDDALVQAVRAGGKIGVIPRDEVDESLIARLCRLGREAAPTAVLSGDTPPSGSWQAPRQAEELCGLLAPPGEPDELGRIGTYGILRVLGSGGMGIVFAARQAQPRRVVALKMILAGPRGGRSRLERFQLESEILARLRHPNIVQVHEVGAHDGRAYFTMDYAEGGSLAQTLALAPLLPRGAAELILALARTVHSAHEQGVVHRDLKPSNVLLSPLRSEGEGPGARGIGTPLIVDFGLAKQLAGEPGDVASAHQTETGAILGTPGYMAPEQAGGPRREIGPAADVYALGAILYECLTGRPPFKAVSVLETLEQVRSQDPVPPARLQPKLPRDLQTICLKCLEKEPKRRYPSAQELADDLGRFLGGEPIRARPVTSWERAWKWVRRQPAAAGLLAVSAASLVTLMIGILVYNARLWAAVERAEAGEAKAKWQQLRADANYRQARATVQRMLTRLDNQGLAGVPRLKELEQQQLEDALGFYQEILQGLDSPDPEVRLDVARACRQTGAIQTKLGRNGPAEKNLRQAIDLAEGLKVEAPANAEYRAELAAACTLLGEVVRPDEARLPEADRWLRQALTLRRELSAAEPTPARRHDLAETVQALALLYFSMPERWNEAKMHLEEAGAIWEQLIQDRPEEDTFQVALANTYSNLGHFYEWSRPPRADDAQAVYRKAEPLLQALVKKQPGKIEWAASLASLYSRQGNILIQTSKPELALARFTSALDTVQALLKQEPRYAPAQLLLLHAHGGRAYAFERLSRFKEAVPEWDRVVELEDRPSHKPFRRSERAVTLARTGDHVRAAAEAENMTAKGPVTNEVLYNSACAYSLAVSAALQDVQLTAEDRKLLAEKYSLRGVALLSRLRTAGFFKTTGYIKQVQQDADFEPLRRRPDCRQLLRDIEQGK